jgi:hypothetical protein
MRIAAVEQDVTIREAALGEARLIRGTKLR